MATITLTQNFSNLDNWPGRLLQAEPGTTTLTHTATSFSFRMPSSGVDFANYRVVITGTGFTYNGDGVATGGAVSKLQIFNAANQSVITFSGITSASLAYDFSQLYSDIFGAPDYQSDGPSPSGFGAMSHLMSGNDVINGTSGQDGQILAGFNLGNDIFKMGAGDDEIGGSVGNDTIYGGDGYDRLSYRETTYDLGNNAYRGVTINVDAGTALDPWGGTDRFTGIESFGGSRFNDKFFGSLVERDDFRGGRGADFIDGGDISFSSNGDLREDRRDRVSYQDDYWQGGKKGITVDLETSFVGGSIKGFAIDGFGNRDTLVDIERVVGTRYGDKFTGSRSNNQFDGGEGKDSYNGGAGSDGINFDRWFRDNAPTGVNVNLALASNQIINDGFGNSETAISIEELYGTERNDILRGNSAENWIEGNRGADTLAGGGGVDHFYFNDDGVLGQGDRILDFKASGTGADRLSFEAGNFAGMTTTVTLVNGTAATSSVGTFIFNAADDTLYWDSNGTGAGGRSSVAVLVNVASLTSSNFELF